MTYLQLPPLPSWFPRLRLQTWRPQRTLRHPDPGQAAHEACASEGAELELRTVEFDGKPYGALYRNGELVCLLPQVRDH